MMPKELWLKTEYNRLLKKARNYDPPIDAKLGDVGAYLVAKIDSTVGGDIDVSNRQLSYGLTNEEQVYLGLTKYSIVLLVRRTSEIGNYIFEDLVFIK